MESTVDSRAEERDKEDPDDRILQHLTVLI
jgi:hypothetical protein